MITGETKNLGVIGYPVAHSLSPLMQNAALKRAGLNYIYIAMPVAPQDLSVATEGLKRLGFKGFNVTIPHKTAIIKYLDEIDKGAAAIGAVNTVVEENGRWKGYNTDCLGFMQSVMDNGISVEGKNVVLIGAGGAASAVVWGLLTKGVHCVTLAVRNPAKAQSLVCAFSSYGKIHVMLWEGEAYAIALKECDLLINCTPLGMAPEVDRAPKVDWENLNVAAAVCDLIYTPVETKFLQKARQRGHKTLNGEGMLIGQGAAAFRLWTGVCPDTGLMRQELHKALQTNSTRTS